MTQEQQRARRAGPVPVALGSLSIVFACFCFGSNSLVVKTVSSRASPWAISFVRFAVGFACSAIGAAVLARRAGGRVRDGFVVHDVRDLVLRSIFGCAQMLLFFLGIALTSSGRTTLLGCTHPIFAALFGLMLFGEKLPKAVFLGVVAGFAGAAVVFWDGSSYSLFGNLVSLAGAACNGMAFHFVKRLRRQHSTFLIYLWPCVLGLAITAFALPELARLRPTDFALMAAVGAISFTGQIFNTWGFKYLPATAGSMLGLSEVIFALSMSAAILGEVMPPRFFLGAVILLGGLVFTMVVANRARKVRATAA